MLFAFTCGISSSSERAAWSCRSVGKSCSSLCRGQEWFSGSNQIPKQPAKLHVSSSIACPLSLSVAFSALLLSSESRGQSAGELHPACPTERRILASIFIGEVPSLPPPQDQPLCVCLQGGSSCGIQSTPSCSPNLSQVFLSVNASN